MNVRFGDVRVDTDARQVWRQDVPAHLSGKAFELLRLLLERRPAAVSKAEIQDRLWPDTFVSEANLPTLISEVRDAIGDDARQPRFVRTVFGFGYAFSGDVVDVRRSAYLTGCRCWLVSDAGRIPLLEGDNIIGRGDDAGVRLESPSVSRHHAVIRIANDVGVIEDLASKNGTIVNGVRISAPTRLDHGVQIRVGAFLLTFHGADTEVSTSTETVG